MNHQVQTIDYKQLSDQQFAICSQCCGEKIYTNWHTMHSQVVSDPDKRAASIAFHQSYVAENHEAGIAAEATIKTLVGTTTTIILPAPDPSPAPSTPDPTQTIQ